MSLDHVTISKVVFTILYVQMEYEHAVTDIFLAITVGILDFDMVVPIVCSVVVATARSVVVATARSVVVATARSVVVATARFVVIATSRSVVVATARSVVIAIARSMHIATSRFVVVATARSVGIANWFRVIAVSFAAKDGFIFTVEVSTILISTGLFPQD